MATPIYNLIDAPNAINQFAPGTWADYTITTRLERDRHRYMMGISSPGGFLGGSAAFVQLAADTVLMTVEWAASCFGGVPWIPDPTQVSPQWILLDDWLEGPAPTVPDDSTTPLYTLRGCYIYGNTNPSIMTFQDFIFPRFPWLQDVFSRIVPPSSVQGGIVQTITAGISTTGTLGPSIARG